MLGVAVCFKTACMSSTTFAVAQPGASASGFRALHTAHGAASAIRKSVNDIPLRGSTYLPAMGGVLLLCACAMRGQTGRRAGRAGHRVVTCNASSAKTQTLWQTPAVPVQAVAPFITQKEDVLKAVSSRNWAQTTVQAAPIQCRPVTVALPATPTTTNEPVVAGPRLRGRPARLAGSSRHSRSRSTRSSQASARAARRSVGARLQPAPARTPAVKPSFDASRQRTKIQVGLRAVQRAPSCSARESQTPSTSHGLNDQSGVLVATYFETSGRNRERQDPGCQQDPLRPSPGSTQSPPSSASC